MGNSNKDAMREYMAKNAKNPVTIEHVTERVLERFYAKVDKTDTCWNWTGAVTANRNHTNGYGFFNINKRPFYAHRLAVLMEQGYLTDGLVVHHMCQNTLCVNPDHLQEITNQENIWQSPNFSGNNNNKYATKSICKYGHQRTPGSGKMCEVCYEERLINRKKNK